MNNYETLYNGNRTVIMKESVLHGTILHHGTDTEIHNNMKEMINNDLIERTEFNDEYFPSSVRKHVVTYMRNKLIETHRRLKPDEFAIIHVVCKQMNHHLLERIETINIIVKQYKRNIRN